LKAGNDLEEGIKHVYRARMLKAQVPLPPDVNRDYPLNEIRHEAKGIKSDLGIPLPQGGPLDIESLTNRAQSKLLPFYFAQTLAAARCIDS
jgi:hypothetical protein